MPPPKHIIVVDDDSDDLTLLHDTIKEFDPSVVVHLYRSAKELLAYCLAEGTDVKPNLLIIDYNMPELTGSELLSEFNKSGFFEGIPKVIWSTSSYPKFVEAAKQEGAQHYFVKPTSYKDYLVQVQEMMAVSDGSISH